MIFLNYAEFSGSAFSQIFILVILFLAEKDDWKGYYKNESLGLAWDCVKVRQMPLFIATLDRHPNILFCQVVWLLCYIIFWFCPRLEDDTRVYKFIYK